MRLRAVFLTVFVVAGCGLGYEIVAGALASYLLGDAVAQFSTAIGLYLCALGIGAWASRHVKGHVADRFVDVEIGVALLGGTLAMALHLAFATGRWFRPTLYAEIMAVGTLVGLEVPLLLRILEKEMAFKDLVARVLFFDYVGALAVSLAFPLLFVPRVGLMRTSLLLGVANAAVAIWSTYVFEGRLARPGALRVRGVLVLALLAAGIAVSERVVTSTEAALFEGEVVFARSTPYQRIVVTTEPGGIRLWLNGALQFSSADEYRYHEALVHPALALSPSPRRVLVLGGGDGLAVREILRHAEVERVTLVDLDPAMTDLARTLPALAALNRHALDDPRVTVVNDDAMHWLEEREGIFDVVIADFPDPATYAVGKLYTTAFYARVERALAPDGALAVQATSPLHARRSFWCIARTVEAAGFAVRGYHVAVPSFHGDWGFVLASRRAFEPPAARLLPGLRSLDGPSLRAAFTLSPDVAPVDAEVNRLDTQVLVRYYEDEWKDVATP